MKLPAVLASFLFMLAEPALAKECRIPDPKPGQPIQVPAECKDSIRSKPQKTDALKSKEGVINLGYGTTLQIGGRVRAEMGLRR
jgi:hypothetical protein